MLAVWCVFLSGAILLSERESSLHSAARGVMVVSFSLAFIYIFTVAAVAGGEVDNKRGSADGARLFRRTFVSFVVAIVAWIGDIVLCEELQALPAGLPYPNLHALGWHFGTCYGLLQLFCLMLLHQHTVRDGLEASMQWGSVGLLPTVIATAHEL